MKTAYVGELTDLLSEIDTVRARMEQWYALRLDDEKVTGDHLTEYENVVSAHDAMLAKITTSTRLVKNAVVAKSNYVHDSVVAKKKNVSINILE